jgi:hypothetical protein
MKVCFKNIHIKKQKKILALAVRMWDSHVEMFLYMQ